MCYHKVVQLQGADTYPRRGAQRHSDRSITRVKESFNLAVEQDEEKDQPFDDKVRNQLEEPCLSAGGGKAPEGVLRPA